MVKVKFYGELANNFNKEYNININSIGEALYAININSKRKLYPWLIERDKHGIRYKLLINNQPFKTDQDFNNLNNIAVSDLTIKKENLKSIDVVPVIEGADGIKGIFTLILGVVLIIAGIFTFGSSALLGTALIIGGIGLVAGGVINLLMKPPEFEDFREIVGGGRGSYLFNGPQNVTREGGPVPVGYGRLIVGSQVISAAYTISNITADADIIGANTTDPGSINIDEIIDINNPIYNFSPSNPLNIIDFDTAGETIISLITRTDIVSSIPQSLKNTNHIKALDNKFGPQTFPVSNPLLFIGYAPKIFSEVYINGFIGTIKTLYFRGTSNQSNRCVVGGNFEYYRVERFNRIPLTIYKHLCWFASESADTEYGRALKNGITNGEVLGSYIDSSNNTFICGSFTTLRVDFDAADTSRTRIAKIDSNYDIASLATNPSADDAVRTIITDSSGNIYIGGDFINVNATARSRFAKIDGSNGSLIAGDWVRSFDNGSVKDIKINSDSKIYVCGSFTTVDSSSTYKYIVRLKSDGTKDPDFVSPTLTLASGTASINSIYIQIFDSKILIGGKWDSLTSGATTLASKNFARLNTDGSIDKTLVSRFDPSENCDVFKITCRDDGSKYNFVDGKIFIGGNWAKYDGKNFPRFNRINNGTYGSTAE